MTIEYICSVDFHLTEKENMFGERSFEESATTVVPLHADHVSSCCCTDDSIEQWENYTNSMLNTKQLEYDTLYRIVFKVVVNYKQDHFTREWDSDAELDLKVFGKVTDHEEKT